MYVLYMFLAVMYMNYDILCNRMQYMEVKTCCALCNTIYSMWL